LGYIGLYSVIQMRQKIELSLLVDSLSLQQSHYLIALASLNSSGLSCELSYFFHENFNCRKLNRVMHCSAVL